MDHSPFFQVSLPGQENGLDILGLWHYQSPAGETARPAPAEADIGSIWRVELPADLFEAETALKAQELHLQAVRTALPAACQQLNTDLRALPTPEAGTAFSLDMAWIEAGPDTPRGVLQRAAQYRWPQASFGLLDRFTPDLPRLEEAGRMVSLFAGQVRRTVEQLALVETSSGGRRLGTTRVGWSGDVETWWASGIGPEHYQQHVRVFAQVLATRQEWLKVLLAVSSGAVRVAAALATGPFSLLAIWTVWNYLRGTAAEISSAAGRSPGLTND